MSWTSFSIYLKSQNKFWNLKILFKSEKNIISEKLFQRRTSQSGSMWVYQTLSHDKLEYKHMAPLCRIHVWNKFSDRIILFQMYIKFSNFKTCFEISNKFKGSSRHRSFLHAIFFYVRSLIRLCQISGNVKNVFNSSWASQV